MCESKKDCRYPERLKGRPGDCEPEQVRECHGEEKRHPCGETASTAEK